MHFPTVAALLKRAILFSLFIGIGCSDGGDGEFVAYDQLASSDRESETTDRPVDNVDNSLVDSNADQESEQAPWNTEPQTPVTDPSVGPDTESATTDVVTESDPNVGTSAAMQETSTVNAAGEDVDTASSGEGAQPILEPREIKLLVPEKTFQTEGPDSAIRVSYDDIDLLKILNMEPVPVDAARFFPEWLAALDGRRIRIRGFMYPTFKETGIQRFLLARDNQICCFGRDPKIYDLVRIRLRDGVETRYIEGRPFDVVGVFHIRPDVFDDQLDGLYIIEDAVVIDR